MAIWRQWGDRVGFLAAGVFLTIFLLMALLSTTEQAGFHNEPTRLLIEGWSLILPDGGLQPLADLPQKIPTAPGGTTSITRTLPEDWGGTVVLCFRTAHQSVRVFFNGYEIYTFGQDPRDRPFGKSPGNLWNLVRLPSNCGGGAVTIEVSSPYQYFSGAFNEVRAGTKAAHLFYLMENYLPAVVLCLLILLAGLILRGAHPILRHIVDNSRPMMHLGSFAILISLWMLGESMMIQFFSHNQFFFVCLTFLSLMLFPIALIHYLVTLRVLPDIPAVAWLVRLLYLHAVVVCAVQLTGLADFIEMLPLMQGVLLAVGLAVMGILLRGGWQTVRKAGTLLSLSLVLLLILGFVETALVYLTNRPGTGNWLRIGVLFFIVAQTTIFFQKTVQMVHLSRIAGIDMLTGCKNRTAYMKHLEELPQGVALTVVSADLNDLKLINDNYGHAAGDDALRHCAHCLCETFNAFGDCYRVGGDEFTFLGEGLPADHMEVLLRAFEDVCAQQAAKLDYPFHVAVGYACTDATLDTGPDDTLRRADQSMYARKRGQKQTPRSRGTL